MAYKSTNLMFRSLDDNEEKEFKQWAHDHSIKEVKEKGFDLTIIHPVIRAEWIKMGKLDEVLS